MKYLFKFGLPAVQDLVSSAESVRDSASASAIVSHAVRAVIARAEAFGAQRLLPYDPEVCSNLITCEIEGDETSVRELGAVLCGTVEEWWIEHAKQTVGARYKTWEGQLRTAFAPVWTAIPFDAATEKRPFEELQSLYDRRKHTRLFEQNDVEDTSGIGEACFLCASRPAVARAPRRNRPLCAVCTVKRTTRTEKLGGPARIPSTHEIAAAAYLDHETGRKDLDELKSVLEKAKLHYRDLEASSLEDLLLGSDDLPEIDQEVKERLERIKQRARKRARRQTYYGVCIFDGDEMGRWFSGARRLQGLDDDAQIERLGTAITEFTRQAASLFLPKRSLLAYLGGDDGMLFLPLDGLLAVAAQIRRLFADEMRIEAGEAPTLSMSLVIAHAKAPLQSVLAHARRTLEIDAKESLGGDAVAVSVILAQGTTVTSAATAATIDLPTWLQTSAGCSKAGGALSRRFWVELSEQAPVAFDAVDGGHVLHKPDGLGMLEMIAARAWGRHTKAVVPERDEVIGGLLRLAGEWGLPSTLENFQAAAKIVDFLARDREVGDA